MSSDDKGPRGDKRPFGKKPFKASGRKFGDKKFGPGGDRPQRGPRAEGERSFGDRPARPYGKRNEGESRPRPVGDRDFGPKKFGARPTSPYPKRPERAGGPRPVSERGPRAEGERSFGDRPARPYNRRPERDNGPRPVGERAERGAKSPFRGMYGGPKKPEGEYPRGDRPFRRNQREPANGPRINAEEAQRPHLGEGELRYHGKNACLGLFKARPEDIVRLYVRRDLAVEFAPLIEYCAKNHKSYHLVEEPDLERLSASTHHQGICLIAGMKRFFAENTFFSELGAHRTLVLYLDGVANPHNLGAIIRTAAHFGVKFVCVPMEEISKISPALYRTAEGGAEAVNVVRIEDPEKFLDRLRHQGFQLYAFEAGPKSVSLFDTRLNEKAVFVFGAEVTGLSGLVKTIVESKLQIPGTGEVESLNVSVAAAIAMAEFGKQGVNRTVRIVKKKP
jgi:TrmH RNA methyltransferase